MSEEKKCAKKIVKKKFISVEEDFEYSKDDILLNKKSPKRQKVKPAEEKPGVIKSIKKDPRSKSNNKETQDEICKELTPKVLNTMKTQTAARKDNTERFLKSLNEVIMQLESDHNMMKNNEQKIESIFGTLMKYIQQSSAAHIQNINQIKEIHAYFKKECEDLEADHNTDTAKLAKVLDEDIKKLQDKLTREAKLKHMEILHESIKAMQNDF